jgi:signal transduction histidine kinase/vacuolar-type H+-ATPase subunit H
LDIKWKNRLALIALILIFTFGLRGIFFGLAGSSEYFKLNYFQTREFEAQLNEFTQYLSAYELYYMTTEEMKKEITVTSDEINEHRYRYGDMGQQIQDIQMQYSQKIREAELNGSKELAEAYTKERDTKIEDIKNNFLSDEHVRAKIIKEKEQKVEEYQRGLERSRLRFENLKTEFSYYLKDTTTGKVYTNLPVTGDEELGQFINRQTMLTIINNPLNNSNSRTWGYRLPRFSYDEAIVKIFDGEERRFEGQIAVPKTSPSTSTVLMSYYEFQEKRTFFLVYTLIALFSLILSIYFFRRTTLINQLPLEKARRLYHYIPLDVRGLGFVISCIITFVLLTQSPPTYRQGFLFEFLQETLTDLMGIAILVVLTGFQVKFWFEKYQSKDWLTLKAEWYQSFTYKAYNSIREVFLNRSMGTQLVILMSVIFVMGVGAVVSLIEPEFLLGYIPFCLIIGIPTLVVIVKRIGYFNRIVMHTSKLAQGNTLEPDLPIKGKSALAVLAGNINSLKNGVKSSQKEQAKSERLKTELITNVSHDLRTPLTSIITYTELLKAPGLTEDERDAYVQILDRKAQRLKILIDDLFEVSKMASGNIELVKSKVDLVQLLQQALGEHNEAVNESTLSFRVSTPDKPLYAVVDGQKLWRVFDNLIGNILKYSLENTRVYITIKQKNGKAEIVFKNVTKYELGENVDELFERFKRGDTSRHTEGSGLGLAIAKSIVDLHGEDMNIEIDGDLFKVTIIINSILD